MRAAARIAGAGTGQVDPPLVPETVP